jgi:hypothetical protein
MKNYDDIINLPHHISANHAPMSLDKRAAQFAPFAALTGYDEEIEETARFVDEKLPLDDDRLDKLNKALQYLDEHQSEKPLVTVTHFVADKQKSGGIYQVYTGNLRFFDSVELVLKFTDRTEIAVEDLFDLFVEGK